MGVDERWGELAVATAVAFSVVSLGDAVWRDLGGTPIWDDGGGRPWATAALNALATVTFAALALVVAPLGSATSSVGRATRWSARSLVGSLGMLAVAFAILAVLRRSPAAVEVIAGVAFAAMFVAAAALGLALLRRGAHRVAGSLLAAPLVVVPAVVLLSLTGWDGAHPAYAEAPLYLGCALLGLRVGGPARQPARAGVPRRHVPS